MSSRAVYCCCTPLVTALAFMLHLAPLTTAGAQVADSLMRGARVRVWTQDSPKPSEGRLERVDSTAMHIRLGSRYDTSVRFADVDSVHQHGGPGQPWGAGRGAVRGLKIGGAVTLLATGIALGYDLAASGDGFIPASVIIGAYGIAFTGITTGVGAVVGLIPRRTWVRVR